MRIAAGAFRGRALAAPRGRDTRPTSGRARQAIFDMLLHGPRFLDRPLTGATVLDAFAGTGAMGLEALSRGAAQAIFLETAPEARACIETNIAALGVGDRARLIARDATRPGPAVAAVSHAFLDPPYDGDAGPRALTALAQAGWLADGAVVVLEHARADAATALQGFSLVESRGRGAGRFDLLRYAPGSAPPE